MVNLWLMMVNGLLNGFPACHGGTPLSLDGFCFGKSESKKWMMTGGTPLTQETPTWAQGSSKKDAMIQ